MTSYVYIHFKYNGAPKFCCSNNSIFTVEPKPDLILRFPTVASRFPTVAEIVSQ